MKMCVQQYVLGMLSRRCLEGLVAQTVEKRGSPVRDSSYSYFDLAPQWTMDDALEEERSIYVVTYVNILKVDA
jgi:hypothetical protein